MPYAYVRHARDIRYAYAHVVRIPGALREVLGMRMKLMLFGVEMNESAYVCMRLHASAFVSIRQHTSAYVSIRQHSQAYTRQRALEMNKICVVV